jgi:tRNA-specific 2-thiouridylase
MGGVHLKRALIAMSGGVDSSVAAWFMQKNGYECIGAMMKLLRDEDITVDRETGCCSINDGLDAQAVAGWLGIPFYVFNFTDIFAKQVMDRFAAAYQQGLTPNPCIDCNRYIKFDRFLKRADEIGCDCMATGHYARITRQNGRFLLKKSVDASKDQSYVLYTMTQEQLARTIFPLGEQTKAQVREIAMEQGFVNAKKRDSQDICFAPDGDYAGFIEGYTGVSLGEGFFLDTEGHILGTHKGIPHYTVGQRKGLKLNAPTATPFYVCAVCAADNSVTVGRASDLYASTFFAGHINIIAAETLNTPLRVTAKIRYRQPEQPATVWQTDKDTLRVTFDTPQRAITKGQAVVLYDGDVVIGGGTITETELSAKYQPL